MPLNTIFEKETCSRCGGTGQYSYNQVDGSRCYGCHGRGERLTKRGSAAAQFFRDSCMVPAGQVKIGDVIPVSTFTGNGTASYRAPVVEISERRSRGSVNGVPYDRMDTCLTTQHSRMGKSGFICQPDRLVQVSPTGEDRASKIQAALDFQATLTKNGQPRKRAA